MSNNNMFTNKQEKQLRKEFSKKMNTETKNVTLAQASSDGVSILGTEWWIVEAVNNIENKMYSLNVGIQKDRRKALFVA